MIDPSLNLGTVVQLVGVLLAAVTLYIGIIRRMDRLQSKVNLLWTWFKREHGINGKTADDDAHEKEAA